MAVLSEVNPHVDRPLGGMGVRTAPRRVGPLSQRNASASLATDQDCRPARDSQRSMVAEVCCDEVALG
jgi:hypothetical protein